MSATTTTTTAMAGGISEEARRKANLRVLQRSDPNIEEIVGAATHVGLYAFSTQHQQWEKKQVEGSLFLCKRRRQFGYLLIILNRHSTNNFVVDVEPDMQLQNKDPYLMFRRGEDQIQGIWFHNGQERNNIAQALQGAIRSLAATNHNNNHQPQNTVPTTKPTSPTPTKTVDRDAAAEALLSPLTLGNNTIPVSRAPPTTPTHVPNNPAPDPNQKQPPQQQQQQAAEPEEQQQDSVPQSLVLDKKSLQLSLLSLIQDERFLDLIHAQYLKVAHARANRKPGSQ